MQPSSSISLGREPPFRIGRLHVEPPTRQVRLGGEARTLEPRVMQVLIALARTEGAVVSREALVERCWDGRIVGENAINRVISRLRHLAAELDDPPFRVETITKVGYRLTASVHGPPRRRRAGDFAPAELGPSRRVAIGGMLATFATGAAGVTLWRAGSRDQEAAETARQLVLKGTEAQRAGFAEAPDQALAYFREATEIDPASAEAWGGLALAYVDMLDSTADIESVAARSRSAAHRALELDPNNAEARAARVLARGKLDRWAQSESDIRQLLSRFPTHWRLRLELAALLGEVGRWRSAIDVSQPLVDSDPFLPRAHQQRAIALWSAGRLDEAERAIDHASEIWPRHFWTWMTRFNFLALGGRPDEALALLDVPPGPPLGRSPLPFDLAPVALDALKTRRPAEVRDAIGGFLNARETGEVATSIAVLYLSALGAVEPAFALLDPYFFGRRDPVAGRRPPLAPPGERPTWFLFAPPTAPLRADARFEPLLEAIRLEDYWRVTRTRPDYRATEPQRLAAARFLTSR